MFDKGQKQSSTLSCDSSYLYWALSKCEEQMLAALTAMLSSFEFHIKLFLNDVKVYLVSMGK